MDLTNEQWSVLEPLIGEAPKRADGRGRPWRRALFQCGLHTPTPPRDGVVTVE